jgi:hypothetical protein
VTGRRRAYLRGLLSPIERENSWQLAEVLGYRTLHGANLICNCRVKVANWPALWPIDAQTRVAGALLGASAGAILQVPCGPPLWNWCQRWICQSAS